MLNRAPEITGPLKKYKNFMLTEEQVGIWLGMFDELNFTNISEITIQELIHTIVSNCQKALVSGTIIDETKFFNILDTSAQFLFESSQELVHRYLNYPKKLASTATEQHTKYEYLFYKNIATKLNSLKSKPPEANVKISDTLDDIPVRNSAQKK